MPPQLYCGHLNVAKVYQRPMLSLADIVHFVLIDLVTGQRLLDNSQISVITNKKKRRETRR